MGPGFNENLSQLLGFHQLATVSCALKLAEMRRKGDRLKGDVILATHICPNAPTQPHEPVAFMGSPVGMETMNRYEVDPAMDAILSVDTTKGNRIINFRGFAITPTVKEGFILKVSDDLLDILQWSTGRLPRVVPISTQDITPYGNGVFHINSILQPAVATSAPVVGIAITAETAVPGCGTGASRETDIEGLRVTAWRWPRPSRKGNAISTMSGSMSCSSAYTVR